LNNQQWFLHWAQKIEFVSYFHNMKPCRRPGSKVWVAALMLIFLWARKYKIKLWNKIRLMDLLPENIVNLSAVITQQVNLPVISERGIGLDVLRLDKIDPVISGNKWFKLKYYLQQAMQAGQSRLLTFGGAWSNHILATACAANKAGLGSIGIIRGEKPPILSYTLLNAIHWGMELVFVNRETYNQKKDPAFINRLLQEYDQPCIIPEGGEGEQGVKGAAEICRLTDTGKYTHLACAVGTGTLLSGLIRGSLQHQQMMGIAVLKGFDNWVTSHIISEAQQRTTVLHDYHFGGYAKKNGVLLRFMNEFYEQTSIPTDFVYTGKLFFAISDLIAKDYFPKDSRLLIIHSGGLQGNGSLPAKTLVF
jgi:1-aminocyclopropane-1-carboxylate deaminase